MIAEERWIISSLNLLAVILLVQVNMLVGFFAFRAHFATVNQDLLSRAAPQPVSPQPAPVQRVSAIQAQDLAFFHAEAQEIPAGPYPLSFLYPV